MTEVDRVPDIVRRLVSVVPIGRDYAVQMVDDPRMQRVWKNLRAEANKLVKANRSGFEARLHSLSRRLQAETWLDEQASGELSDVAAGAVLLGTALELGNPKPIFTEQQLRETTSPWRAAAWQCTLARGNPGRPQIDEELRDALSLVKNYFEEFADMVEAANHESPYFLKRSSGQRNDDITRAKVTALGKLMRDVYGSSLVGTLTLLATILLGVEVRPETVRDWCEIPP